MFLKFNWPGIAWALFILILSGFPGDHIPHVITFRDWMHPDKVVHLIIYGIFVLLLLRGFNKYHRDTWLRRNGSMVAMIIGIVFGLLTEIMQACVFTGRSGNIYDWIADILGCLIGWSAYLIFFRRKERRVIKN